MKENPVFKPASQDEMDLYCFMGEAICKIQILEDALSTSITLKKHSETTKEEADDALAKQRRRYTLGKAVQLSEKEQLYPLPLQKDLNGFYNKRNWLVHQSMVEYITRQFSGEEKETLFQKIKAIGNEGHRIQREIEFDLIEFCKSKGKDMSEWLSKLARGQL
jgi:hypothetical protein